MLEPVQHLIRYSTSLHRKIVHKSTKPKQFPQFWNEEWLDSGNYWEDVQRALHIAAGLEKWPN